MRTINKSSSSSPVKFEKFLKNLLTVLVSAVAGWMIISCGDSRSPVTKLDLNIAPIAIIEISPSIAVPGEVLTLSASTSYDEDGEDGDELTYAWEQTSGETVNLSSRDAIETSFVVPNVETVIRIQLIVTDTDNNPSEPAVVNIPVTIGGTDKAKAIFVSSERGSNAGGDGSFEDPVMTIAYGMELARESNYVNVYVMPGEYKEELTFISDINLIGGLTSLDEDGNPIFGNHETARTTIKSLTNGQHTLKIDGVENIKIENFVIEGTTKSTEAKSIIVANSTGIEIINNTIITPGSNGADCIDLDIDAGSNVFISGNQFTNSENCSTYSAISVEKSDNINIYEDEAINEITLKSGNNAPSLTAIKINDSQYVGISGTSIKDVGNGLSYDTLFTGVSVTDSTYSGVSGIQIDVEGGIQSTGIMARCYDEVMTFTVSKNIINLHDFEEKGSGIRSICKQQGSQINVYQNKVFMKPKANWPTKVRGIEVSTLMRNVNVDAINNIVSLPVQSDGDSADKNALRLEALGSASKATIIHNTFLVTGNSGALYAVYSNSSEAALTNANNVILVFGSNASNAVFYLKKTCSQNNCLSAFTANLVNSKFYSEDLKLIKYDDGTGIDVETVGSDNFLEKMTPNYFDMNFGELLPNYQSLAMGNAYSAGIINDVDDKTRDSSPDIGATEY